MKILWHVGIKLIQHLVSLSPAQCWLAKQWEVWLGSQCLNIQSQSAKLDDCIAQILVQGPWSLWCQPHYTDWFTLLWKSDTVTSQAYQASTSASHAWKKWKSPKECISPFTISFRQSVSLYFLSLNFKPIDSNSMIFYLFIVLRLPNVLFVFIHSFIH